jgi:16S rRNA C967 or C1407 C5-methylase (RsmB/RsmF family)
VTHWLDWDRLGEDGNLSEGPTACGDYVSIWAGSFVAAHLLDPDAHDLVGDLCVACFIAACEAVKP